MGAASTSDAMLTQAAAWLARLRSEERTPADEAGFRAWLAEHAGNRQAFDDINAAFELAGAYRGAAVARRRPVLWAGAAAGLAMAAGLAGFMLLGPGLAPMETFSTNIGEQRTVALADGSMVLLDTASKIEVRLSARRRRVDLVQGRAHFEVAKDPRKPFVVEGGSRSVTAVGTVFDVWQAASDTSVLLTEGKVLLRYGEESRLMAPGDRIRFRDGQVIADRPALESQTAWQTGRAVFEAQPLSEVVAELNRYSRRPLVLADRKVAAMKISGAYKTGDVGAFAVSLSRLLPIDVITLPDRVVLQARAE